MKILTIASECCWRKRAFLLVDPLNAWDQWDTIPTDSNNLAKLRVMQDVAVYFPRVKLHEVDPESKSENSMTPLL